MAINEQGWYVGEDGAVVIPEGCTPCCGLPNGSHYMICPAHGDHYSAEQEAADEPWFGMNREDWDANAASARAEADMEAAYERYARG